MANFTLYIYIYIRIYMCILYVRCALYAHGANMTTQLGWEHVGTQIRAIKIERARARKCQPVAVGHGRWFVFGGRSRFCFGCGHFVGRATNHSSNTSLLRAWQSQSMLFFLGYEKSAYSKICYTIPNVVWDPSNNAIIIITSNHICAIFADS